MRNINRFIYLHHTAIHLKHNTKSILHYLFLVLNSALLFRALCVVYRQQYAAIAIYKLFANFKCLELYVLRKFYNLKCFKTH